MNTYLGRLCSLAFVVLVLSACGGGGGGSGNSAGGTPSVKTKPTTITVINGYIKGAIVYVDKNDNGDCDPDETQGTTDENGKVTLNIPEANVGKYPIVADVPADAIDSDTGKKVGTAFTLIAPKEHSGVVSPFTTLVVQKLNANKNLSFSDAQLLVAKSNGFELSVISSDFMSNPTARTLARTLVALQKDRLIELDKVSSCKAAYKNDVIQAALNDSMSSIIKIKACSTADEQKNGVACAESINSKAANFVKDTDSLANAQSFEATIAAKPGTFSAPVKITWNKAALQSRNLIPMANIVKIPVFGLYANYANQVSVKLTFSSGNPQTLSPLTITTPAGPTPMIGDITVKTARTATSGALGYDFIMSRGFAKGSPVILDTDGNIRWTYNNGNISGNGHQVGANETLPNPLHSLVSYYTVNAGAKTAVQDWQYDHPEGLYSNVCSSAYMAPDQSLLVLYAIPQRMVGLDASRNIVFDFAYSNTRRCSAFNATPVPFGNLNFTK